VDPGQGDVSDPLVTVVTPSLNQGKFIGEALESVLGQDYPHIEHLVVDGGSTDGTLEILRAYAERYPDRLTWTSARDRGQAEALNKGFKRAGGEILGWLNADDVYEAGAFRAVVRAFGGSAEAAVVYGRARFIGAMGEALGSYPVVAPFDWHALAEQCYICQPAAFIRRQPLLESGLLDERLHSCMDYDLWIRLGNRYKVQFIDAELAVQRMHAESKTLARRGRMFIESLRTVKRHYGYVPLSWCQAYAEFLCYGGDQFFTLPETDWRIRAVRRLLFLRHNVLRPDYILAALRERQRKRRADRV
jgi:glycosyltransferase involved in cell wall biosynthesis